MTHPEFIASKEHQRAAKAYAAAHGGLFVCEEPGDRLVYVDATGVPYTPPNGATAEDLLRDMQNGNPLPSKWPELECDPALDY